MKNIIVLTTIIFFSLLMLASCVESKKSNEVIAVTKEIVDTIAKVEVDYLEAGKQMAMQTKSSLAKHLVEAIGEKGPDGAVEFCNIKAIPITDSMSIALDASIKRVSDKPRNPNNQANKTELYYIKQWQDAKTKGQNLAPQVTEIDGKMVGYYPIITNQMCMQCHGKPKADITPATLTKINKLYTNDKAKGYNLDEIRGIFVVEMKK